MAIQALLTSAGGAIPHPGGCGGLVLALALAGIPASAQSLPTNPHELLAMDPLALSRLVDERRPAPVPTALRAQVLAGLPKHGVVEDLDDRAQRKLAAIAPVLLAAQRASVYAIRVIDVPHAFVGLHGRTVVLISLPALRVLTEDELRAVVAHETGHEYIHAEYERATAKGSSGRLQDLELVCDIIAVITLGAIGQEASTLVAGIEKLLRFDRLHFGGEMETVDYPSPLLRRSVILGLEKRIRRGAAER